MKLVELEQQLRALKVEMRIEMDRGVYTVELYWLVPERIYERCGAKNTDLTAAVLEALTACREAKGLS